MNLKSKNIKQSVCIFCAYLLIAFACTKHTKPDTAITTYKQIYTGILYGAHSSATTDSVVHSFLWDTTYTDHVIVTTDLIADSITIQMNADIQSFSPFPIQYKFKRNAAQYYSNSQGLHEWEWVQFYPEQDSIYLEQRVYSGVDAGHFFQKLITFRGKQ